MRVKDIMTIENLWTITSSDTAERAKDLMREKNIHHLIVMDNHVVTGIISDRDLINRKSNELVCLRVQDLMNTHLITAESNTTLKDAANLLRGHAIACLPIMEEGQLAGILTISDLLDALGQGIDSQILNKERRTVRTI